MMEGKRNTDTSIFDSLKIYEHLPLATIDEEFGRKSKIWKNWISHPIGDEYWKKSFYQDKFDRIDVPVLHISGWYDDDDVIGTHTNYVKMTASVSFGTIEEKSETHHRSLAASRKFLETAWTNRLWR